MRDADGVILGARLPGMVVVGRKETCACGCVDRRRLGGRGCPLHSVWCLCGVLYTVCGVSVWSLRVVSSCGVFVVLEGVLVSSRHSSANNLLQGRYSV